MIRSESFKQLDIKVYRDHTLLVRRTPTCRWYYHRVCRIYPLMVIESNKFWLSYGDTICRLWVIMFTVVWRGRRLNVLLNVIIVIVFFWIRTICVNHVCCSSQWTSCSLRLIKPVVLHQTPTLIFCRTWHSPICLFIYFKLTWFHFDRIIHVAWNFCTVRPNLHPPDLCLIPPWVYLALS